MKRFIAGAFATALLVTSLTVTGSPAYAHTETCAGSGSLATGPVYLVGLGPSASGPVTFTFTVGACLVGGDTTVNGTFSANPVGNYCEYSTGTVTTGTDILNWVNAGYVWTFTGTHGGGVLVVVPNSFGGQSCVTGATDFLFVGSISTG
ncbi:MAG: hypothetical protein KY395_00380 [Actinobacteria bacterium]|nr:hypothetical protein [Actinomycetota bacterium]